MMTATPTIFRQMAAAFSAIIWKTRYWRLAAGFLSIPTALFKDWKYCTTPAGRNISEAFRRLEAFQHVRNSKVTEATPSRP